MKISVVISAYNEEKLVEDCLKSVDFADEIIFLDNSSTDNTAKIAEKYTSKIFKQKNDPDSIDLQKNLGFEKAKNDWILSIDADERVSAELKGEIEQVIKTSSEYVDGYEIPRKNIIFGKWIQHTGWYPDPQLRLFKSGKGKFTEKFVHAPLKLQGKVGQLKNHLIHENFQTIAQFVQKTTVYAKSEADKKIKEGYVFSPVDAIKFPFSEFLSRFFAREGYKDGLHGFMLSVLMAFYHFLVFSFLWEKHNFKQIDENDFIEGFNEEVKNVKKDLSYWIKLRNKKNLFKKLFSKS